MIENLGRAVSLRDEGKTLQEIADHLGATRLDILRVLIHRGLILDAPGGRANTRKET